MERCASPKPAKGSAKREKARARRQEAAHGKMVREKCVVRDGYCAIDKRADAITQLLMPCGGPSEWAHVEEHRRCNTRGQAPEVRHTTAGSGMLCRKHHRAYDAHEFDFRLCAEGMNGPLAVVRRAA